MADRDGWSQRLRDALRHASGGKVQVASRHNIVVSSNVGNDGGTHHASARQDTEIRQSGGTEEGESRG